MTYNPYPPRAPKPPKYTNQQIVDGVAVAIRSIIGAIIFIKGILSNDWTMIGVGVIVMQVA